MISQSSGPVVHLLEFQPLHRRAGDDKAVEVLVAHRVEGGVEGLQVLGGRVLRVVARGLQKLHFNLQRRVRQLPQNLGLRGDLGGHEVQQQQPQRTNVLVHGAMLGHDEDVLVLQRRRGRQRIGNANGHASSYSTAARAWSMIGDEVGGVLDAAGQADEVGADAGRLKLRVVHLAMGGVGRVQHAGAGVGHMGGNLGQLQALHERLGRRAPAGHAEAHHAAGTRPAGTSPPAPPRSRRQATGWRTQATFGWLARCSATARPFCGVPGHAQVQALQPQVR